MATSVILQLAAAGLICGAVARYMQGGRTLDAWVTALTIGAVGSFAGATIDNWFFNGTDTTALIAGVVGAVVLLLGYRQVEHTDSATA